jgi:hypothetical protein
VVWLQNIDSRDLGWKIFGSNILQEILRYLGSCGQFAGLPASQFFSFKHERPR